MFKLPISSIAKAIRVSVLFALSSLFVCTGVAAEDASVKGAIDIWTKQSGVVVTDEAGKDFTKFIIGKSTHDLSSAGFQPDETVNITKALASGGYVVQKAGGPNGFIAVIKDYDVVYQTDNHNKTLILTSLFSTEIITPALSRYPTVKITVTPTPPVDYTIDINGKIYQPTTRNEYCTTAGAVKVKVLRISKPPCEWSGDMADGAVQEVTCKFE